MSRTSSFPLALPRRERAVVLLLLAILCALAWAYTGREAQRMAEMDAAMWRDMQMSMNGMEPSWSAADTALTFVMWSVMMAAMMLPGAAPMIGAFARINARRRERNAPYVPTMVFLIGYLGVWAGISLIATGLQWVLQSVGLVTTMLQSASPFFSAGLFLAAGVYQFSSLKERCLSYCRSTDGFVLTEWRDGKLGAVIMGLRHGMFCALCCGGLMLLLFAVAVMDLRWVAALAVAVSAEKLLPHPKVWRVGLGLVLLAGAVAFAAAGVLHAQAQ